jgi:hypothetical protein
VKLLQSLNEAEGLVLHARTAMPLWLGERLDIGYAIDVLHPLAVHLDQRSSSAATTRGAAVRPTA